MPQTNIAVEKVPPQNIETEMAALGSMMLDREAMDRAAEQVVPESFYHLPHKIIFAAMLELYQKDQPLDSITLTDRLHASGKLEAAGGAVYLSQLVDCVPTTAHIGSYLKSISDKAIVRELIGAANDIIKECYEQQEVDVLLDEIETRVFELSNKKLSQSFSPTRALVDRVVDNIEKLYDNKHYVTGLPTGFYDLDELTSGFQKSDMIVLASRPSMGKTSLALTILEHMAVEQQVPVAIFSLEMSSEQLVQRMLCSRARVDAQAVRKGMFKKDRWEDIIHAAGELTSAPIYINDSPSINALQLRAIARRLKSAYDIQFIVVDYIQLMQGVKKYYDSRQQEISDISRCLKALARELGIPVLVLSQLNREVESRPGRVPQLSDLRESGAIEQDADVVILLVRQEHYDPTQKPGIADIVIAKQRNGPVGKIKLQFEKEYTRFGDLSREKEPNDTNYFSNDDDDGFEPS